MLLLIVVAASLLTAFAFADGGDGEYQSNMYSTFWALVPPIIAIVLALITKEVYSSLFIGVLAGTLFYANFSPILALDTMVSAGFISAVADSAGIFFFLVLLGIIVALVNKAGGSAAFGRWAEAHIKSRVGAMFATFILGILIFIDDYFNCLTVGSVMRPVTDGHRISRAKLAYLIDATAAPVCMIAPISSWAAAVSGIVEGEEGIMLFIKAIPYNLYSLLTFVFIIALTLMKFDYGPMRLHEMNAILNNDVYSGKQLSGEAEADQLNCSPKGKVIDLIIPIVLLVVACIAGMLRVGYANGGTDIISAFGNTDAFVGLPWGAILVLVFAVIYFICRRVMTFKEAMECIPKGFIAMVPALIILTFALTLKNVTGLLGGAQYVHDVMYNAAPGLSNFLPAIIFLVACLLAFSTGTSWGTFGILIPIVTYVFAADPEIMIIGVSATLAGAVCGDHCSPISDTTIMSSAGAQCEHVVHVSTQLPYAITVAAVSFVGYIVAAFTHSAIVILLVSSAILVAVLFVIRTVLNKKDAAKAAGQ